MTGLRPRSRQDVQRYQREQLRRLLEQVWERSRFYRDYYAAHGIRARDLAEVGIDDLPLLAKGTLMDAFDEAVTDPRLRRADLERWLQEDRDPRHDLHPGTMIVHTTGSTGRIGIFVYDRRALAVLNGTVAAHLAGPDLDAAGRTRVAFHLQRHGHFIGVKTALRMPPAAYDVLLLSVLEDSFERVVEQLNAFQPHRLTGLASSVSVLAEAALTGALRIRPRRVLVTSDLLSDAMAARIREAFGASVFNLYAASESPYIALGPAGGDADEMTVFDELNLVEILTDDGRPAAPGASGRVVLTNLYNYALPLIRYELGDYAQRGTGRADSPFSTIRKLEGRVNDALPVVLADGSADAIHPVTLAEFYVAGLERVQFVSERPDRVRVDYLASHDLDASVRREFARTLELKGAGRTAFEVRRVPRLRTDAAAGKQPLVVLEGSDAAAAWAAWGRGTRVAPRRLAPTHAYEPFERSEIEQSIVARFEARVRRAPGSLAIAQRDRTLTYAELNRAANRVAHAARARLGPGGEPIALLFGQGPDVIVGLLGALKAGRPYVPLDPDFPPARNRFMLADSGACGILTDGAHAAQAEGLAGETVAVIDVDALHGADGANPPCATTADSIAYVLYTSGSTGTPKGVFQNHRNVLHNMRKYTNGSHIAADDRLSLLFSCSYSAAVTNVFGALLNGAALFPYDIRRDGLVELGGWLRDSGITVYHSVAAVFRHFVETLGSDARFPDVRLVELTGEPVTAGDVERYRRHYSRDCLLHNRMAATEMSLIRSFFADHDTPVDGPYLPVGYELEDTEVVLLDDDAGPAPPGEAGEIAIRSRYLVPGYWRNPELTRERFLPDPAGGDVRLYRTGDLGRLLPDGCLLHLGRRDAQVKIRGHRIHPAEVQLALVGLPEVDEAAVLAREDETGEARLVAWVVPAPGHEASAPSLRRALRARLPEPMVPSAIVLLDALPLTPAGKLDRDALPAPSAGGTEAARPYVAPRDAVEATLAELWQEILGIERVGAADHFFDLGGHSLQAARLFARIEERLGVRLPLSVLLLEAPTVGQLASAVRRARAAEASWNTLVPLQTGGDKPPLFCIHGAEGHVLFYRELARLLGESQPFYAIEPRGLDDRPERLHTRIEEMAAHYVEQIRSVQPRGPYYLGGRSFGGVVAFEMAHQLRAQGEAIAALLLFDTWQPRGLRAPRAAPPGGARPGAPRRLGWRGAAAAIGYRLRRVRRGLRQRLWRASFALYERLDRPLPGPLRNVGELTRRATSLYQPRPYPGRMVLFRARAQPARLRDDPHLGWHGLADEIEVIDVEGRHRDLFEPPYVELLAKEVEACLARARGAPEVAPR